MKGEKIKFDLYYAEKNSSSKFKVFILKDNIVNVIKLNLSKRQ